MRKHFRALLIGLLMTTVASAVMGAIVWPLRLKTPRSTSSNHHSGERTATFFKPRSQTVPQPSPTPVPKSGYLLQNLRTVPGNQSQASSYSVEANPAVRSGLTRTGNDSFFIDDSGVIRHSGKPDKSAQKTDHPI